MLKTIILNVLLVCFRVDRMLPRELLKSECEMQLRSRIGDSEFDTALGELTDGHFVSFVETKLSGDRKYFITDLGRAQL